MYAKILMITQSSSLETSQLSRLRFDLKNSSNSIDTYKEMLIIFSQIAYRYIEKNEMFKAAAIYQLMIRLSQPAYANSLFFLINTQQRLQKLSISFLHTLLSPRIEPKVFLDILQISEKLCKLRLQNIRQQVKQWLNAYSFPIEIEKIDYKVNKDIYTAYLKIYKKLKDFLNELIQFCINVLGPIPCQYTVIGLGSFSKHTMTPYSDLEFAILIEDSAEVENYKIYFRHLTYLLHWIVIQVGETIIPSIAPELDWFYDCFTPQGFAFDGNQPHACKTPLGKKDGRGQFIYELIQTPQNMAKYVSKISQHSTMKHCIEIQDDYRLSTVILNGVYIMGDERLFKNYQLAVKNELTNIFSKNITIGRQLGIIMLEEFVVKTQEMLIMEFFQREKLLDIKKNIYRVVDIMLEGLGIYFGILGCSHWKRINFLYQKKIISFHIWKGMQHVLSIVCYLRLFIYNHYGAQRSDILIPPHNSKYKKPIIFNCYKVNSNDLKKINLFINF